MKPLPLFLFCLGLAVAVSRADDQTRDVQAELKNQGFYFGEVNGTATNEYFSAIKRFQIRNGLQPTGQVNDQVLQALGFGQAPPEPEAAPPPAPTEPAPAVEPPTTEPPLESAPQRPPVDLRRNETVEESDRRTLRQEIQRPPRDSSVISPPAPLDEPLATPESQRPDPRYADVFAGTPYRSAPQVVQYSTVRRAQQILAGRGMYRGGVDGIPGPATEEAILDYQRSARLPMSGRLDLETLNALRLLPGRGPGNPALKRYNEVPGQTTSRPGGFRPRTWVE
jgi:peptidoglycan hydrolase-like protein with peptidoglycan-binding domain